MSIANPDSVEDCKPSLTLLVCLYFEEECVEEFVRQVTPKLDAVTPNWELLFIDDGSLDETIPIVKQLASAEPRKAR
ncbi:MAG: glycosyltransferase, partial [Pirellulaceae bacterium]|nr:glycosyltransferase [Pirellulaceae bacterium]